MLSNNCSILLIDDDADVLDAYTQLLEQAGYHVSACNNPFDAREQVPKDWPGIVLSDVCMPGCSGIDLMTVFHQDDDLLPILLITGHGDVPMAVEAVKKGAWDFLQKPIDPGKLLTLVDAALRQRQSVIARRQYCQQKLQVELIGRSQWTVRYRQRLQQLAETDIPERQLSIVLKENSFGASGLAVHKDGRIFIASVGDMQRGSVRAIEPNGTREQMIVAPDAGFLVNDLVFDNQGGFYFTDSRGDSADPQGGVFYVCPNVGSIHAILPGLAVGNGIAIDPAGSQIWATEHAKNRLHRVRLSDATTVAPFGSVVTYQFTGPAPDGARVDSEGNVYVAISGQGRVMVFNRNGLPIGQIVLPDRDKGRNLKSTSLAIRPGHRELFIVANSGTEPGGAMIFRSGAFAPAPFPFSHQ